MLFDMPKTSLTIEESEELDKYTRLFHDDLWRKGLTSSNLSKEERNKYYELGGEIMSDEGFASFYQGLTITQKLQEQIDSQVRLFLAVKRSQRLETDFMPLTTVTALQFKPILAWIQNRLQGSDVFERGIMYRDVQPDEIDLLYRAGAEFLGDDQLFKRALYEQKLLNPLQQQRVDESVRAFLRQNQRLAWASFPWTALSNEEFNDVLRVYAIITGSRDFYDLVDGKMPSQGFNEDLIVFTADPELPDPK